MSQLSKEAKDNLEAMLLSNNGLTLEMREGMGRLAVATKDFDEMGETVIRELPSLVWRQDDFQGFLRSFKGADIHIQNALLDMYHPPLSSPSVVGLRGLAVMLSSSVGVYNDVDFIHKLLAILTTNAHQYYGEKVASAAGGDLRQHECLGGYHGAKKAALFVYGSKINHSCLPNLTYTSKTDDGALEYKVIRPIKQGEPATFSYIGELFQSPRGKRRDQLLQTKSFTCECKRCMGPDYCRYIKCTGCEKSYLPCIYNEFGRPTWTCEDCGARKEQDIEDNERKFLGRLHSLAVRSADEPLGPLQSLANDASKTLSPVHYITIEALENVAQLSASKAASQEMMQGMMGMMGGPRRNIYGSSNESLRQLAAQTGLVAVLASECVAADCPGCYDGVSLTSSRVHAAVYELGSKVFHACTDLMEVSGRSRPVNAVAIVERYLPSMRGHFGEKDADVQLIEDKIVKPWKRAEAAKASNKEPEGKSGPGTGAVTKKHQQSRRSNKKQRKGKGKK